MIRAVGEGRAGRLRPLGRVAQKKAGLLDTTRHTVLHSAHPSPLSAKNGFFGSKPFSKVNAALLAQGVEEIDWQLPDV